MALSSSLPETKLMNIPSEKRTADRIFSALGSETTE